MTTDQNATPAIEFTNDAGRRAQCKSVVKISEGLVTTFTGTGVREMVLVTGKHFAGGIAAQIECGLRKGPSFSVCHAIRGEGDFTALLESQPTARCTEKAVRALHAKWHAALPDLVSKAKAYYAAKEARDAQAATTEAV
jgi:hypothetical protein